MNKVSRRSMLKLCGATLGSAAVFTNPAMAFDYDNLQVRICNIIYGNIEGSRHKENIVDEFAADLVSNRLQMLEDQDFLNKESKRFDQSKFERFVVFQFIASSPFLEEV